MEQTNTISETEKPSALYWPACRGIFLAATGIVAIITILFAYQVLQPAGSGINLSAVPEWVFTFLLYGSWTVSALYLRASLRKADPKFRRVSAAYLLTGLLCLVSWTVFASLSNFANLNLGLYGSGLLRLVLGSLSVILLLSLIATTFIMGIKMRSHRQAGTVRACGWTLSAMSLLFIISLSLISYTAIDGSTDMMGYATITLLFSAAAIVIAPLFFFKSAPESKEIPVFTKRWLRTTYGVSIATLAAALTLSLTSDKTDMDSMDGMEDFMEDDFDEEYMEDPDSEYVTDMEDAATVSDEESTESEDETIADEDL